MVSDLSAAAERFSTVSTLHFINKPGSRYLPERIPLC